MLLRRRHLGVAGFLLALAAGSCTTSTEPTLLACTDPSISGGGGELLLVSSGTTPSFSWSPACKAYSLLVTDSIGNMMWGVISDSGSTMAPGVSYGVVPTGPHKQVQAPVPLLTGKSYAVGLYRPYVTTPTPSDVLGAIAFRP